MRDVGLDDAVRAIARWELPGVEADQIVHVEPHHVAAFVSALAAERVVGVAAAAADSGDLVGPAVEAVVARHDETMASTLRVERTGIRVSTLLGERGIDHRLLKGTALAHTVVADPSQREFRDVDVLVRSRDIDQTVAALTGAGAARRRPELRPGFDRRFAKSVTMRLDGVEVDVHRTLAPGPFGLLAKPDDVFLHPDHVSVGGVLLPTLDRTDHLVHALYHVALGGRRPVMTNLRDVVLLADGPIDRDRLDETVRRWEGGAVIDRALNLLDEVVDIVPPALAALRQTLDLGRAELIDCYTVETDRFRAMARASFGVLPISDRAAFARAVGLPDDSSPTQALRKFIRRR